LEFLTPTFLSVFVTLLRPTKAVTRSYDALFEKLAEIFSWSEVEYFLPIENAPAALKEIQSAIKSGGWKINFPARISFVQQDNIWLSEAFGRDSACIEISMFKKASQWKQFVKKLDTIMKKYEGRPHWGKYHQLSKAEVSALYPRFNDFQEVRKRLDPNGTFLGDYLAAYFD
jgi:L-gulonolactone oxidase